MVRITGVDLDWQRSNGRLPTYDAGSDALLSLMCSTQWDSLSKTVYLPDCDESYAIIGRWLLDGLCLEPKILNYTHQIPIQHDNYCQGIHFVEVPGYELVVSTDPFNQAYSIRFVTKHR